MWASEVQKTNDKKGPAPTLPLDKYIDNARMEFKVKRAEIPKLLQKVEDLSRRADGMTGRHQVRLQNDLRAMSIRILEEVRVLKSMERETEFEQKVAPYLHAYMQRIDVTDKTSEGSDVPRNITMPGYGKKKESIDTYVQRTDATASRKNAIVSEFLMDVHHIAPKVIMQTRDVCPLCKESLILSGAKAMMTCPNCGYSVAYLDATMSSMSYSDDIEFSSFSYKRINHFNEWLQQVQAKEHYDMSDESMRLIMEELVRQRVESVDQITQAKVREALKVLKMRKAYEHVTLITCRLTGARAMRIPADGEETCRLMFIAVQPAFEKHCPSDRKNFLSYSYCLYKFFQLLGYDEFLKSFTLLKGRDKLARQDDIFKCICQELDWEFIPSV